MLLRLGVRRAIILFFFGLAGLPAQPPQTEFDIHYARGSNQTLDLYLPAGKGFTTIVYTYGGGWHSGSGKSSAPIAEELVHLGYGCALVSHRLFPPDPFPAPAEDLAAAFAWVKSTIASRDGDPARIILAGHSSGAHLSLLIATDPRYLLAHRLTPADIRAVIGLSPPVDLSRRADGRGYGDVLFSGHGADPFQRDRVLMEAASPIRHVSPGMPPTLLVIGGQDFPMLEGDARAFARKAEGFGDRVRVIVVPGEDHLGVARGMIDTHGTVLAMVQAFIQEETTQRVR
jgi:acetyl esterase/lipase